jgi:hypothetical protein
VQEQGTCTGRLNGVAQSLDRSGQRGGFLSTPVFAKYPLRDKMAVLMPHHHFSAASSKTIPLRESDCAANRLGLACIGLRISPAAPDDLPPGLLADDHIS